MAAVAQAGHALRHASEELKNDKEIVMAANLAEVFVCDAAPVCAVKGSFDEVSAHEKTCVHCHSVEKVDDNSILIDDSNSNSEAEAAAAEATHLRQVEEEERLAKIQAEKEAAVSNFF